MKYRAIGVLLAAASLLFALVVPAAAARPQHVDVIVVMDAGQPQDVARDHGVALEFVYETALLGFAGSVPEGRLNGLRRDPRVTSVELDQQVRITAQEIPMGIPRIFADDNTVIDIDGTDDWRVKATVAVLDTGIDFEHPDLNVNVDASRNCLGHSGGPPGLRTYECVAGGDDDHYHGTHVAGTVGALDNGIGVVGVAPGVELLAIKVLDSRGSGSMGGIVAGIEYITALGTVDVANMSLGCECSSDALDAAIANSVEKGVTYAVSAGNSGKDSATFSPASHPDVITVSALADFDGAPGGLGDPTCRTDEDDTLANFSNYGSSVEITAPGVCILSTYPIEQGSYGTISGTSMSSPHVAGAAALLAASGMSNPGTVRQTLIGEGNFAWIDDSSDGITEPLLDVSDSNVFKPAMVAGGSGTTEPAPNTAPIASFTYNCTDLACNFTDTSTDDDGTIASRSWDFGAASDGSDTSTDPNPSYTYSAGGTYTVTLTVTDDDGATNTAEQQVTVSTGGGDGGITLSVSADKTKGMHTPTLTWSRATGEFVDVKVVGVGSLYEENDGTHVYETQNRGSGSYTFQICEAGTTTCSDQVTVTY